MGPGEIVGVDMDSGTSGGGYGDGSARGVFEEGE